MSYTQQLGDNPYHLYDKIIMTDNPIGILALKTFTYVARLKLVLAFGAISSNECKLYIIADDLIELISQSIYKSFIKIRHRFLEFKELIDLIPVPKFKYLPIFEPFRPSNKPFIFRCEQIRPRSNCIYLDWESIDNVEIIQSSKLPKSHIYISSDNKLNGRSKKGFDKQAKKAKKKYDQKNIKYKKNYKPQKRVKTRCR